MKIARCSMLFLYSMAFIWVVNSLKDDEVEYKVEPNHVVVPRSIRVFSKGPDPDDLHYEGPRIDKHLHNVFQGGTVGVKLDLKEGLGKIGSYWDKFRKYLPTFRSFNKRSGVQPRDKDVEKDVDVEDPVGRGFINPRIKPPARVEEPEWERV